MPVELILALGLDFSLIPGPLKKANFRTTWKHWGSAITERYIAALPGSRPLGAYLYDGLPLPKLKKPSPPRSTAWLHFADCPSIDFAFTRTEIELEHLIECGEVKPAEEAAAWLRLETIGLSSEKYACLHSEQPTK